MSEALEITERGPVLKRPCSKCGYEEHVALRDDGTTFEDSSYCEVCRLRARVAALEEENGRPRHHDVMFTGDSGDVCAKCGGVGRRIYGDTSTWRHRPSGQMVTEDVCDSCWGSGKKSRQGANLRKLYSIVEALQQAIDYMGNSLNWVEDDSGYLLKRFGGAQRSGIIESSPTVYPWAFLKGLRRAGKE